MGTVVSAVVSPHVITWGFVGSVDVARVCLRYLLRGPGRSIARIASPRVDPATAPIARGQNEHRHCASRNDGSDCLTLDFFGGHFCDGLPMPLVKKGTILPTSSYTPVSRFQIGLGMKSGGVLLRFFDEFGEVHGWSFTPEFARMLLQDLADVIDPRERGDHS